MGIGGDKADRGVSRSGESLNGAAPRRQADRRLATASSAPVRVVVADSRRLCRECIRLLVQSFDPDLEAVEAESLSDVEAALAGDDRPTVVLYNPIRPGAEGVAFVRSLCAAIGDVPLIALCDFDDPAVMRAMLECGAKAFLPATTPSPVMVAVLHLVLAGGVYAPPGMVLGEARTGAPGIGRVSTPIEMREAAIAGNFPDLTLRQRQVLALLSQGLANREIAAALDMRENTVKAHVKEIMRKLGADNRTRAALMADRLAF